MKKDRSTKSGKAFDLEIIKRMFSYTKPYRIKFWLAVIVTLCLSGLAISRPLLIQHTIDESILSMDKENLFQSSILLVLILISEAFLQYFNIYTTGFIGQSIIRDLRKQVFTHILQFKTKYFDNTPVGMLVTRSVSDIEALADVFSQGFVVILGDIFTLIVFIVTMFLINWELTLVVLSTVPLLIVATKFFKNGVKSSFTEVRNAVAALNSFVQEQIQGMKIVQVFNREEEEFKKFQNINENHKTANIKSIWYYSIFFPIVEILSSVAIGLLIWYSGLRIGKMNISAGEITFFIMLTNMLFRPIRMLADRLNTLQMGIVSGERVFQLLDTTQRITNTGTIKKEKLAGKIEFENVWFAYSEENFVLRDISFSVNPGETIALVGATGAGKSSVINLLGRFYEIQKGKIKIDEIEIDNFDLLNLRNNIGIVMQDVFLFSDSIFNNISLKQDHITLEQVIEASKAIGAHEFIMNLPDQYHFQVKERGAMLSVGQRQLISFIRAYVFNPAILVLDEATSSIDSESERLVQQAIEKLTINRTCILIAHRLGTIKNANRIIVLDKGEIIESGTLNELLQKKGHFKKLYDLQFKEASNFLSF